LHMDLTVSLLKYRRTLGKASAILNTDAVGIGWERQYGVRFQTARSKSTEYDQRRFAPLQGGPALFLWMPRPMVIRQQRRKAGATYAEDLCAGRQCPPPGPLRSGVLRGQPHRAATGGAGGVG